jgi:hypothetical protein
MIRRFWLFGKVESAMNFGGRAQKHNISNRNKQQSLTTGLAKFLRKEIRQHFGQGAKLDNLFNPLQSSLLGTGPFNLFTDFLKGRGYLRSVTNTLSKHTPLQCKLFASNDLPSAPWQEISNSRHHQRASRMFSTSAKLTGLQQSATAFAMRSEFQASETSNIPQSQIFELVKVSS